MEFSQESEMSRIPIRGIGSSRCSHHDFQFELKCAPSRSGRVCSIKRSEGYRYKPEPVLAMSNPQGDPQQHEMQRNLADEEESGYKGRFQRHRGAWRTESSDDVYEGQSGRLDGRHEEDNAPYDVINHESNHDTIKERQSPTVVKSNLQGRNVSTVRYPIEKARSVPMLVEIEAGCPDTAWGEDCRPYHEAIEDLCLSHSARYRNGGGDQQYPHHQSFRSTYPRRQLRLALREEGNWAPPPRPSSDYSTTNRSQEKTIEIAPGHRVRLRGADETWRAISCDFYLPSACACCDTTIFCVEDAHFVLCPLCKVISPMEDSAMLSTASTDGGVGLGFTMEELAKWQEEIEQSNSFSNTNH